MLACYSLVTLYQYLQARVLYLLSLLGYDPLKFFPIKILHNYYSIDYVFVMSLWIWSIEA